MTRPSKVLVATCHTVALAAVLSLTGCYNDGVNHLKTDPQAQNLIAKNWTLLYTQLIDTSGGGINVVSTSGDTCLTTLDFEAPDLITETKRCTLAQDTITAGAWTWYVPPANNLNLVIDSNLLKPRLLTLYHYTGDTLQLCDQALVPNSDLTKYYLPVETFVIK